MPKITEIHSIDITPERFLNNCSGTELQEVNLLLNSRRFQERMYNPKEMALQTLKESKNDNFPKGAFDHQCSSSLLPTRH